MPAPTPEEITDPKEAELWRNLSRLYEAYSSEGFRSDVEADFTERTLSFLRVLSIAQGKLVDGFNLSLDNESKNNHIMLSCPHCNQNYVAKIGNNPLVRDGLTITPLPLSPDVEAEGEQ